MLETEISQYRSFILSDGVAVERVLLPEQIHLGAPVLHQSAQSSPLAPILAQCKQRVTSEASVDVKKHAYLATL